VGRSILGHLYEWHRSVPLGTEGTVAKICQFRSKSYGSDMPSPGAIAARLFPTGMGRSMPPGFEPAENQTGTKKVRTVEIPTGLVLSGAQDPESTAVPRKSQVTLLGPGEFAWTSDYSFMRTMTCKNHPTARYSTKNPFDRSIFLRRLPDEGDFEKSHTGECKCPISDLVVVLSTEVVELVGRFNEQSFSPEDTEGTPEDGPDFNFPLYLPTGNAEDGWIEVERRLRGVFDPDVQWIRDGGDTVEVRQPPLAIGGVAKPTEG
jgi:hypothetical protein